jgi:uncharacterized protein (TIGR00297 family)
MAAELGINPWLAASLAIAGSLLAWRLRMLDRSGALTAALLGFAVLAYGGWAWALLLLAFFASSSLLSRTFKARKRTIEADFAKGGQRDWGQVLANGGVGLIALLLWLAGFIDGGQARLLYAGALATVTADTWATELGVLSRRAPRLVTNWRRVAPGTSGGVTALGTLAALVGAALIGWLAAWLLPGQPLIPVIGAISLAGLAGAFVDSLLGATVQAIYYCPQCDKQTERHPLHNCGTPTELSRGWPWLNNDWVNFLSAAAGGLLALWLTGLLAAVA